MTDRERAVIMAYTGFVMLAGDKLEIYYKYVESLLGFPVWTHEILQYADLIKKCAKPDFLELCSGEPLKRE